MKILKKSMFLLVLTFFLINTFEVKSQENKLINLKDCNNMLGDGTNEILLQISNDSIFGIVDGFGSTYIQSMFFATKRTKNIATGVFASDSYQKMKSPIELLFLNDTMYLTLIEIGEYKKIPFAIEQQEITEVVEGSEVGINLYLDNIISNDASSKKHIKKYTCKRFAIDNINLRQGQSTTSNVITKIVSGDELRVLELGRKDCINKNNGLWVKVNYKGKIGWVFSFYISANSPNQEWNTY